MWPCPRSTVIVGDCWLETCPRNTVAGRMVGGLAAGALPPVCMPGVTRNSPESHSAVAPGVDIGKNRAGPGLGAVPLVSLGTDRAECSWHWGPAERTPSPLTNMTNMQLLRTLLVDRCLLHGRDFCTRGWGPLPPSYPLPQSTSQLWALQ